MNPINKTFFIFFFLSISLTSIAQDSEILKNETFHYFSNTETPDKFELVVNGDSLLKSIVTFNILNSIGDTLLSQKYKASAFNMRYYYESDTDSKLVIDEIEKNIKSFFDESRFRKPAIEITEDGNDYFDEDYSNKEIWNDIKSDSSSFGFTFSLFGESTQTYSYSKSRNEVVQIWGCC